MQQISLSDFENWNSDPVTKAFKLAIVESIGRTKEALAQTAGLDSNTDNFYRGYIMAMYDTLDFRIDELEEVVE